MFQFLSGVLEILESPSNHNGGTLLIFLSVNLYLFIICADVSKSIATNREADH